MPNGYFVLILHTHLPWVLHHGKSPHGVDWLNEAVAECYIPLLNVFNDLLNEGISPNVTLDISPVLCEQLEHPDFKEIFVNYCNEKINSAIEDEKNFKKWGYDPHHIYLTQFWQKWYEQRLYDYNIKYNCSIINAFKQLQDRGAIEIMTCGATHGYLPLLPTDKSINLQIKLAVENYKKYFNREPRGIWLPECAYRPSYEWHSYLPIYPFHIPRLRPGIEQFLAKHELQYFVTDENLLQRAKYLGKFLDLYYDTFVPAAEANPNFQISPLEIYHVSSSEKIEYGTSAVFTRYMNIAMQVWSGEIGYPGEPNYLDFHKKQLGSMLRYWRVTDNKADMMYKSLYHPDWTNEKIDLQSNHFIHHIENTVNWYNRNTSKIATLCTPFDTELFGHWWFEGPEFIRACLKGLYHSPYCKPSTASEQLFRIKPLDIILLPEGSWGKNNNHDVWSNEGNKWTWEAIYNNENRLAKFYENINFNNIHPQLRRILTQALRELLLLESSDWQFLIFTFSAKDYAEQRFCYHHSDFNKLCDMADRFIKEQYINPQDTKTLVEIERRNSIFPELQLEWWKE